MLSTSNNINKWLVDAIASLKGLHVIKYDNDIAEKLGFSRSVVSNYISGKVKASKNFELKFREHFSQYLENNVHNNILQEPELEYLKKEEEVPVYEVNASAGLDFLTENGNVKPKDYIKLPNVNVDAFIYVFGDSMYPKYCSGEMIGIKQVEKDFVMFGHAYVIQLKDGQVYLKYIKKGRDDNYWVLDNENPKYDAKEFHLSKIKTVFLVKTVITKTTI